MDALSEFRGDCDIRIWLCQIAKREYFGWLRKHKRLTSLDASEETQLPRSTGSVTVDLEQRLVDQETAVRIHRLLHEMQEPYKEVFQLRVFGELSFEQIGDIFGKTANWACVTYHRAKSKILKAMEES